MRRTTIRQQAVLLREAKHVLALKKTRDVYTAIQPIRQAIEALLGGGFITHYRDNTWGIYWIGDGARDNFVTCSACDLALSPAEFISRFVRPYHLTNT